MMITTTTTTTRRQVGLSLIFFVFSAQQIIVSGYASWLRCYVELDESEVIMHHHIIPADDEEPAGVSIQVQPYGTDQWLSESDFSIESTPITIKVRLDYPPQLQRQDVQWVIESSSPSSSSPSTTEEEGAGAGAEFIDRGVMCDGSRAFSRSQDHAILRIDDISKPIELVAGYAPGFEAVRLTPKFTISNAAYTTNTNTASGSTFGDEEEEDAGEEL
jgi:hypothetical protein